MSTWGDLKTEFAARGFDYLSDTRRAYLLTAAITFLEAMDYWPWRVVEVTTLTDAAGVLSTNGSPTDVIESVYYVDQKVMLNPRTLVELRDDFGDLTRAGTPMYWYVDTQLDISGNPLATTSLKVFPVAANANCVLRYYQGTNVPVDDGDSVIQPFQAESIILNLASQSAYRDSDNHQAAEALQLQIDRELMALRAMSFAQRGDGPDHFIRVTECW